MPISGEHFDLKVYRNNALIFDDAIDEIISFQVEQTCTAERGEARIRFDGDTFPNIRAGDAIELYVCSSGTILTKVFSGEIEDISKVREEGELFYDVIVHDWSKLLSERKVNLSFSTVIPVKTIVEDIVDNISSGTVPPNYNERKISINNVESITKTRTIDFIGLTMYEALKKLSDYTLCDFYVDPDKDLNWFLRTSRDSEKTLGEDDLQTYDLDENRPVCNQVTVYGAANRTLPEYNLDAWSDSKEGWLSAEEGSADTITVSKAPTEFTKEASPGWTRIREYSEQTQDLIVDAFEIVKKEWGTSGVSPWLKDTETDSISCVSAGSVGDIMEYWTWEDPDEDNFQTNLREWKNVDLKFKAKQASDDSEVFYGPCWNINEFTGSGGNVYVGEYDSGYTLKVWTTGTPNYGKAWKSWSEGTANIKATFDLRLPSTSNYNDGDRIYLATLYPEFPYGSPRASLYVDKVSGHWRFRLYGLDKDSVIWTVTDTNDAGQWYYGLTLSITGGNTSSAIAKFTGGPITLTKTGIDLTGERIKCVNFGASWAQALGGGAENYVLYRRVTPASAITIRCTRRITNFKASLYKWTEGTWKDYDFFFEDSDLSWTWKTIDIKADFSDYDLLQGIRLKLTCYSSLGQGIGKIVFRHALISLKADVYYGTPVYLDSDDGDNCYIETGVENTEDYAWTSFPFSLGGMTEFLSSTITVKGRNSGTVDVSCKLIITDPTTGSEIDLGTKTWLASETSYTEKKWDVTLYLNTEYNLQNTRLKFIKTGASGTVRITYAHIDVRYVHVAGAFISEDSTIKKAGNKSIKLFATTEEENPGIITSSYWRDLPVPIICQTVDHKEGFTKLAFAALIDMYVYSTSSHWERPSAKLNSFTVILRDSDGNKIVYSAGDLYPETTFLCTPGPEQTKMKEISIGVGQDAEANGLWERLNDDFDWASINRIEFSLSGTTDTELEGSPYLSNIELWIDWLHFEEGKWFSEYALADDSLSVITYGRSSQDIFDKTCFSEEDCYYRAKYYVECHKYPTTFIENVEIDYPTMELLNPGEIVYFELPEGNFTARITKITWIWDGDLFGKLDLDNEGFQPSPCPLAGEKITNGGFETEDFAVEIYGGCDSEAISSNNSRLSFHARGYHFIIFSDWQNSSVKYASSPDGKTYTIKETLLSEYWDMWGFSICLDVTTNTVYWIHNGQGGFLSHYLYLSKGTINTDGTISFGSPIQICYNASYYWVPESICRLSSGRLVVTYVRSPAGGQGDVYSKYSDDDGATWNPSGNGTLIHDAINWAGSSTCLPLTSTAVYIIYIESFATTSQVYGKTLDGVSVGSLETLDIESTKSKSYCGMATLDGKIHLLLSRNTLVKHRIRSAGLNGTWNDFVDIETLTNISYSPVPITRNGNGMHLYYVDKDGSQNTRLYYRDYEETNWGDEVLLGQIDDYVANKTWDNALNTNYAYDLEEDYNIFWLVYWNFGDYYDRLMTEDLPLWTLHNMELTNENPHSGTICARSTTAGGYVEQTLEIPVLGSCISVASFWSHGSWSGSPAQGSKFTVIVTYTDLTTDQIEWETTSEQNDIWVSRSFLSIINQGKEVQKIRISTDQSWKGIDDVSVIS